MSLFSNAKTIDAKPAAKKGSKKEEIQLAGIETIAQIDALTKILAAARATIEAETKSAAMDLFVDMADGKRPENFRGVEGDASASVELRKRSTASALNEGEIQHLTSLGLKVEKAVAVQELFAINPAYAGDAKLLEKVSKALEKIVPVDFIVKQEEKSKTVVTDETIDGAFAANDRTAIEIVSVLALKPKLEVTNVDKLFATVQKLVTGTDVEVEQPKAARRAKVAA